MSLGLGPFDLQETDVAFGKERFAVDGFVEHLHHISLHLRVEKVWLFLAHGVHHFESKGHVGAFITEHPVGTRCKSMQQSARA